MNKIAQRPLKYFAYLRKSSEDKERQALSIPAQKEKLEERFPDLDIEFIEEERSAFLPYNRPKFDDMLERIRKGERTGLVGWHPDRISRNEIDAAQITFLVRSGVIEDLRFGTYHFENTPEGIMFLQLALSQSQYESAKKARDVKRGLHYKAKQGDYPGPATLGYLNITLPNKKRVLVKDPATFDLVRRMWDYMLTGKYSVEEIVELANEQWGLRTTIRGTKMGGKKLTKSLAYYVFTRTIYYGEYEYPKGSGSWHTSNEKFVRMITLDEYDKVQVLLGRKGRPRPNKRDIPYRGPMTCGECGGSVTAEDKVQVRCTVCRNKFDCKNKTACPKCETDIGQMVNPIIREYVHYHCTKRVNKHCTQGSIEKTELEKQITAELKKFKLHPGFKDWAMGALRYLNEQEITDRETILVNQRKAYDDSVRRIDSLIDMRANGELTEDEFKAKKTAALTEKHKQQALIADVDARVEHWLEIAERAFLFAERATYAFEKDETPNLTARRQLFLYLGSNYVLKDKELRIDVDKMIFPLREIQEILTAEKAPLEPAKNPEDTRLLHAFFASIPNLLPDLDSNQNTLLQRE